MCAPIYIKFGINVTFEYKILGMPIVNDCLKNYLRFWKVIQKIIYFFIGHFF